MSKFISCRACWLVTRQPPLHHELVVATIVDPVGTAGHLLLHHKRNPKIGAKTGHGALKGGGRHPYDGEAMLVQKDRPA